MSTPLLGRNTSFLLVPQVFGTKEGPGWRWVRSLDALRRLLERFPQPSGPCQKVVPSNHRCVCVARAGHQSGGSGEPEPPSGRSARSQGSLRVPCGSRCVSFSRSFRSRARPSYRPVLRPPPRGAVVDPWSFEVPLSRFLRRRCLPFAAWDWTQLMHLARASQYENPK